MVEVDDDWVPVEQLRELIIDGLTVVLGGRPKTKTIRSDALRVALRPPEPFLTSWVGRRERVQ